MADGKDKYIEMAEFYNMNNVFFLEETSRWSFLIKRAKQNDIALLIDTALHTIEKNNKALKGALPERLWRRARALRTDGSAIDHAGIRLCYRIPRRETAREDRRFRPLRTVHWPDYS